MSRPTLTEVNCETGEVIIRELNDEEFAIYQKAIANENLAE